MFSGTFAVVCLMTGTTVLEYSDPSYFEDTTIQTNISAEVTVTAEERLYTPTEVATAVTFAVAIFQVMIPKNEFIIIVFYCCSY